jgi:hypothetical protein
MIGKKKESKTNRNEGDTKAIKVVLEPHTKENNLLK